MCANSLNKVRVNLMLSSRETGFTQAISALLRLLQPGELDCLHRGLVVLQERDGVVASQPVLGGLDYVGDGFRVSRLRPSIVSFISRLF